MFHRYLVLGMAADWERNLNPWDIAAGILLITEAGGKVSAIEDGEDVLTSGNVVCGNMELHPLILERIRAAI
jgi:myo-inositol-1(or 4)-monophosphatase